MVAAKSLWSEDGLAAMRFKPVVSNRDGKLDFGQQITFPDHRDGWVRVLETIEHCHHAAGVEFDAFVEDNFAWNRRFCRDKGVIPYLNPWVGIVHNPPGAPRWFEFQSTPDALFRASDMQASLPFCRGLFAFSHYLARHLENLTGVEVVPLVHPTRLDVPPFDPEAFRTNPEKRVYQVGSWLRRIASIKLLDTDLTKHWLVGNPHARNFERAEIANASVENAYGELCVGRYSEIERLDDAAYDDLLTRNIVFLDLYDTSANNTVLECIARSTPLVTNRLPALEEYLGPDYPLFYDDLDEAGRMCDDTSLLLEAHRYLKAMDKRPFSYEYFRDSFINSSIYQALPGPGQAHALGLQASAPIDRRDTLNFRHGETLSNPYVFVVAFRNQAENILRCLRSIVENHTGHDYGVIVIDDASSDDGLALAARFLEEAGIEFVAISNTTRKYYTRNLYNAVHVVCDNDETVVIEIDGDDRLEDRDVLSVLDHYYRKGALKTVGRFRVDPGEDEFPGSAFVNDPRLAELFDTSIPWNLDQCFSWMHLKTFKRKLFRAVPLVYFLERGGEQWLQAAEDLCVHPKMVELAPDRTVFIDEILYVYNFSGHDHEILKAQHAAYVTASLYRMPRGSHLASLRAELIEIERRRSRQSSAELARRNGAIAVNA